MADSDPISDSTPNKRRKLQPEGSNARAWNSQEDTGDGFTVEDFETAPTMPLPPNQKPSSQKRKQLSYPASAFHADIDSMTMRAPSQQPQRTYHVTQPTQPLGAETLWHITQPTQPLLPKHSSPPRSDVLVDRSSPTLRASSSSPARAPAPLQTAPFLKPGRGSLLANTLAPTGTAYRIPLGVHSRSAAIVLEDSDDESDPPVDLGSDEETQGLKSNIKPTNFKRGGRGLHSTPNRDRSDPVVQDTPRASTDTLAAASSSTFFSTLMGNFGHNETAQPRRTTDDLASAYGSTSRAPRLERQMGPSRAQPVADSVRFRTLDDVPDFLVRDKIRQIQKVLPSESVQRCHDALSRKRGRTDDAMNLLMEMEEQKAIPDSDDVDELSSMSPVVRKGVAVAKPSSQAPRTSSQPVRARQDVKAPSRTIAEKYATAQPVRKPSQPTIPDDDDDEEEVKPRRRLVPRGQIARSPSPPSSPPAQKPPPQPEQRLANPRQTIVIDDEDDSDSGLGPDAPGSQEAIEPAEAAFDSRLLKFFNVCSVRELTDLSAQPEEAIKFLLSNRPFSSLHAIRTLSNAVKKSVARPIGDRIVDVCAEMWAGYEAVDELVAECEKIAKPIQQTLKGWGMNGDGELQLMNLDEAHDSGIGTPASSCQDDIPATASRAKKPRGRFLGQPDNMGEVELKDYQLVGLNWLNLLWAKKISCILADDMGLGKTCQVIAFLAHLQQEQVDGVHLVIVPGSTLENWLREFARFAPSLKVVPYYGSQAERPALQAQIEDDFDTIDVVVTTYDIAVKNDAQTQDNRFLRRLGPAVCVYDEAHNLRNPKSNRYEGLMKIKADFKILVTGTPLQNNLQELVAILAFIMPDLFMEKRDQLDFIFKHKASTKDADHAALLSAERIARARTMMTPFILRRKKAQVLDLPTKHNRVEMCEMTATQAAHYHNILAEAQQVFAAKAATKVKSKAAAKKDSSNILMALRQAAIHPLLARRLYSEKRIDKIVAELLKHDEFAGNPAEKVRAYITNESNTGVNLKGGDYAMHKFCHDRHYLHRFELKKNEWMDCGKVQKFKQLVTAYAANGDRVLVFSQFTTLMDILEAVLETMHVKFMRLDGSTRMDTRQDMLDKFYDDTSIPVFMLSTKAGGAGINLACANKVIIFDSGFNPQDDIQAENRAHRVGQMREVEVVRLVTRGTIEEQIHALGESKLALDERVAGEGASAAEEKQAEKQGEQMVERMFLECLSKKEEGASMNKAAGGDLKDAFKVGMESAGVRVASKQARY
ncbi:hypothetical protein LTR36_003352 [Oleoguttula mirabilis]|uniref:DNA helicase n=1 Tax=Oleoguttula mirabilis TaxID=1507867 RepID=A0AAV9JXB6_9PEZI|nr:hypothetical protein LTR36_003352 [Oleoguttula mirabilis]